MGAVLQGKSVKQRPSNEAPAVAETRQHPAQRITRSSFDDEAPAEHQSLSAAITPAIERMLQVTSSDQYHPLLHVHSTSCCLLHGSCGQGMLSPMCPVLK